jgi:tetratricopeptide (TPR) repeat protein
MELAQAFISTGELQDALDALNTHLNAQPEDDEARRLRADVLTRFNEAASIQSALVDLRQLQHPTAEDWHKRAILSQMLGDISAAHEAYHEALVLRPADERLTEQWMRLYQSQADFASAQQLVETMPHTWRWRGHAGEIYEALGQYAPAYATYSEAIAQLLLLSEQDGEESNPQPVGWAAPFEAELRLRRANICVLEGLYTEAKRDYRMAAELIPDDPVIPFKLGIVAYLQGDQLDGQAQCQQALQAAPVEIRAAMLDEMQAHGIETANLAIDDNENDSSRRTTP